MKRFSCPSLKFDRAAKVFLVFLCAFAVALAGLSGESEAARNKKSKKRASPPPYAGLVMDSATGEILYSHNADAALHPASLTKIMTLLMVFEEINAGRLELNDRIRISAYAASRPPSKLGLKPGSSIKVRDAIYAVVTKSCNDISAAIAEHISGSEKAFARKMTARARELGMSRTTFKNASGLPDPGQRSSARDMARLARFVINTYPDYYKFYSARNFTYGGQSMHNHNRLMNNYPGMDGMKTGFINASGFNLVASAVRNDRRLIGVVFGGRTAKSRNAQMAKLLDEGFEKLASRPAKPLIEVSAPQEIAPAAPPPVKNLLPPEQSYQSYARNSSNNPSANSPRPAISQDFENAPVKPVLTTASRLEMPPSTQNNAMLNEVAAWAIQIGAYSSRATTDRILSQSVKKLPPRFASPSPMIAPIKTQSGWVFRARLHGLSRSDAFAACKYFADCVPVAPHAN